MKKILITGAAGFIGSHLVELLLKEEELQNLRLFIQENEPLDNLPKMKLDIVRGDIRDKRAIKKAMKDVKIIYHLAARTIEPTRFTDFKSVNVEGTQNLLDECKNNRMEKFILFSSIAVFGLPAWRGDMVNLDETAPKRYAEQYGKSKWEAEKAVVRAHKEWNLPYAIVRPTSVYGPRDKRNLLELYQVIKKHLFFFIGNGRNKMDYVYIGDVVKAARLAQQSPKKSGDYIIGGGRPITLNEVVAAVSESINEKVSNIYVPKNLSLALSYITYYGGKLINIRSPLFPSRVKVMTSNCYFNIKKARSELGYEPKMSFRQGTMITGRWLLKNNLL